MVHRNQPGFDERVSVVEDLDPEQGEGGPGVRRDLLLGMLLLLAVIAFAGWQWWYQDHQSSLYRAGQEAAGRGDLDAALGYFSEASGFSNADALARSTQEQIAARDRLYKSADSHAREGQWLLALRDLRDLAKVQPDYKDLGAREEAALMGIYDDAMPGIVALRAEADPPGLYYRAASGWVRLEGSDARSRLLAGNGQDRVLYDAPVEGWDVPLGANVRSEYQPKGPFQNRQVVAADFGGEEPAYKAISLDPSYYVPLVAGSDGLWGAHFAPDTENESYANPVVRAAIPASEFEYHPYSDDEGAVVRLAATEADSTGSAIVSVDTDSNRYLLAEWTRAGSSGPNDDILIKLYVAAAGSEEKRLVYTHIAGGLESAQISPDGRYVVLHALSRGIGQTVDMLATILVDVETGRGRMLQRLSKNRNSNEQPQGTLTAAFVRRGAYAGKLLLAEFRGGKTDIKLADPATATNGTDADYTLAHATVEGSVDAPWTVQQQDTEGLTLARQTYAMINSPYASRLDIVVFPTGGPPETYKVSAERVTNVWSVRATGCHLYWHELEYESAQGKNPPTNAVYTLHRTGNGREERHRRVFTTNDLDASRDWAEDAVYLGDSVIAYVADGELRARTYDGAADLLLETGIAPVFENAASNYHKYRLR